MFSQKILHSVNTAQRKVHRYILWIIYLLLVNVWISATLMNALVKRFYLKPQTFTLSVDTHGAIFNRPYNNPRKTSRTFAKLKCSKMFSKNKLADYARDCTIGRQVSGTQVELQMLQWNLKVGMLFLHNKYLVYFRWTFKINFDWR